MIEQNEQQIKNRLEHLYKIFTYPEIGQMQGDAGHCTVFWVVGVKWSDPRAEQEYKELWDKLYFKKV